MLVFYGLGNNEPKYLLTKHNAGRIVIENLANLQGLIFSKQNKNSSSYFLAQSQDKQSSFIYSAGYMNNSGMPLTSFLQFYKLNCVDPNFKLIIIHDDSDQIEGSCKLVVGGSSAGHHGIASIYKHSLNLNLPIQNIWRLKIGIRPPENKLKSETFVLSNLSSNEKNYFLTLATNINTSWQSWLNQDLNKLQDKFNKKSLFSKQ